VQFEIHGASERLLAVGSVKHEGTRIDNDEAQVSPSLARFAILA